MKGAPEIGELRLRLTLEQPIDAPDGAGGATRSYAPLARVWAQVSPTRAEGRFVAERQEQATTHMVRIRWRGDVTSQMRFALGARRLLILAVHDADERRRFLICHCEEIAP